MSFLSIAGTIAVCMVWGAGFSFMKIGLRYLPPFCLVGLRFAATTVFLAVYVKASGMEWRIPRNARRGMLVLIVLFFTQQACIFLGMTFTRAGRMGVILNTQPILTAIAAHYFLTHDRLTATKLAGLIVAVCGVALVFRESFSVFNSRILIGDLLALCAAAAWGMQNIVSKHVVRDVSPTTMTCWRAVISSVAFFALSAVVDPGPIPRQPLDALILCAISYLVIVSTVFGFVLWMWLIKHNNPSQVASFCFITPVTSIVVAWAMLGEPITRDLWLAAPLVGLGIFLANVGWKRADRVSED